MLEGLMGAISFEMDKRAYAIGDRPAYRITGAAPGSIIAWTSFKDGVATGEYQADYGHRAGDDGAWQLQSETPWRETDAGLWQKQAVVIPPDGDISKIESAQLFFTVGNGAPDIAPDAQNGLLSQSVNILGQQIPVVGLLAIGGVALFAFSRR